jgi:hypothetical protein
MVGLWGAASLIASVQSGYTSGAAEGSYTATISPVVPENCVLLHQGFNQSGNPQPSYWSSSLALTNATTVTVVRQSAGGSNLGIAWTVLEFVPGIVRSVQAGVVALPAVTTGNSTITQVDPLKSALFFCGTRSDDSTGNAGIWACRLTVAVNGLAVIATRGFTGGVSCNVAWRLVEFF